MVWCWSLRGRAVVCGDGSMEVAGMCPGSQGSSFGLQLARAFLAVIYLIDIYSTF